MKPDSRWSAHPLASPALVIKRFASPKTNTIMPPARTARFSKILQILVWGDHKSLPKSWSKPSLRGTKQACHFLARFLPARFARRQENSKILASLFGPPEARFGQDLGKPFWTPWGKVSPILGNLPVRAKFHYRTRGT